MRIEDCFKIGYIAKTHGLKGEVTAIIEFDLDFESTSALFLETKGNLVPYFPEEFSGTNDKVVIRFEGITSIEQAGKLKGSSLYLPKTAREKSGRGEFYDDEIIGFIVSDENAGEIGPVTEVTTSRLSRIITVNYHHREVLIPVNSPFIKSINKTKKTIAVSLPDGYLEI
jgi:16S rRNA processing protein RimM